MLKSGLHILGFLFFASMNSYLVCAQSFNLDQTLSKMYITGTSNLHDWWADVNSLNGTSNFTLDDDENITINKLNLIVIPSGIKGEKEMMTNYIQKALVSDTFKTIVYQFESVIKITPKTTNTFTFETLGLLTISGTSKQITLNLNLEILKKGLHLKGNKNLKMSDFKVIPPKALLGMLKTRDDIMVYFDLTYQ